MSVFGSQVFGVGGERFATRFYVMGYNVTVGEAARAKMGPRIREDTGGEGVHPHPPSSRGQALTFPPQGGRDL